MPFEARNQLIEVTFRRKKKTKEEEDLDDYLYEKDVLEDGSSRG